MAKHVFISHSTEDKQWVDRLCNALEGVGISCWVAPRDIQPGQSWAEAIVEGIEESNILLFLLSENSVESKYVIREVELADSKDKVLITVRLDNIQPSGALEFFLRLPQFINCLRQDFDQQLVNVIKGIAQHLPNYNLQSLDAGVPQFWQHLYTSGLSIVMGRFNHQSVKRLEQSGLVGYGDVMAISEIHTYLGKLGITNYSLMFADKVHPDLLRNNLIMLGGDVNRISMQFMQKITTNVIHDHGITFRDRVTSQRYAPLLSWSDDGENIATDYGLIVYANSPFAEGRRALYIAGCFGFGTWGGVQHAISYQFMQHELVRNDIPFECLVEVSVHNELPQTVTPLIMRPI